MAIYLQGREKQVFTAGDAPAEIECSKDSLAGSVSQRACVFCGSRVVLYPIVDALHLVHGPIGCAAYTWDIRGTISSGPELHRLSFSTDLREKDIIFGGEKKLYETLIELINIHHPKAAFVYSTCVVGVIGDDVNAICKRVTEETGVTTLPVQSEGFKGNKKDGYRAACEALLKLVGTSDKPAAKPFSINILGDFNLAGELWMLEDYYKKMGVNVHARITGDGRVDDIRRAHLASLNVVQCSGSMKFLARQMKEKYGIPFVNVSYFGVEDMSDALYEVATFFKNEEMMEKARGLVRDEMARLMPMVREYREKLSGIKAAVYVGGAFKAISLIKALRLLGIDTVLAGSQTGDKDDYELMRKLCDEGTIIVDDSNPVELATFAMEKEADIFIGGVKERPFAFKLGMGFCDHNHERKEALAGYKGMLNFAKELYESAKSPVWKYARKRKKNTTHSESDNTGDVS